MHTAPSLIIALAAVSVANAAPAQTEADEYTRYELLAPETSSFKIYYEVTATTAARSISTTRFAKAARRATSMCTTQCSGSRCTLKCERTEARKDPLMADAQADTDYIKVTLARPVPENGQGRIVILKTYKDEKSYHPDGNGLVFDRPLGIKRNKVVLPPGYEVVGLTVPSQILHRKGRAHRDQLSARGNRRVALSY